MTSIGKYAQKKYNKSPFFVPSFKKKLTKLYVSYKIFLNCVEFL